MKKRLFPIFALLVSWACVNAQHKGPIHWLGSTAQNGGTGGKILLDTPSTTFTIYVLNYAQTGYAPVSTKCPAFDDKTSPYWVYRTYDNQHNLLSTNCIRTPNEFIRPGHWSVPFYHERTPDGHFIYVGAVDDSTHILCKADSMGSIIWKRSYHVGFGNVLNRVKKLRNGHYLLYGTSIYALGLCYVHYGHWSLYDHFALETDTTGTVHWTRVLGGSADEYGLMLMAEKQATKGFYFMGFTFSTDHDLLNYNCKGNVGTGNYIASLDSAGQVQCINMYISTDRLQGAVVEPNDDLVVMSCGHLKTNIDTINRNKRFQVSKMDSAGTPIWHKQYGFDSLTTHSQQPKMGIIKNPIDDGYVIWGTINNDDKSPLGDIAVDTKGYDDIWVGFLSKNGDLVGQVSYGGNYHDRAGELLYYPANQSFLLRGGSKSGTNEFTNGHYTPGPFVEGEGFLTEIKYWPTILDDKKKKVASPLVKVYPNPAQAVLNLEFSEGVIPLSKEILLLDINGRVVKKELIPQGVTNYRMRIDGLPPAPYIVNIKNNNELLHSEQILIK